MTKLKIYKNGKLFKKTDLTNLTKEWMKSEFYGTDVFITTIPLFIKSVYGDNAELKRKDFRQLTKETSRLAEIRKEKRYTKRLKIQCEVYNQVETFLFEVSELLEATLKEHIGKQLFNKNGWRSKYAEKVEESFNNDMLKFSVNIGKKVTLVCDTTNFHFYRQGNWLELTFHFMYNLPWSESKIEYKRSLSYALLDDETKQLLAEFNPYKPNPPIHWKDELKLIRKKEALQAELDKVSRAIKINYYFNNY